MSVKNIGQQQDGKVIDYCIRINTANKFLCLEDRMHASTTGD